MAKKQAKTKSAGKARKATKTAVATAAAPKAPRELVRDPRLPAAGTVLTRSFKGAEIKVTVLDDGFRFDGKEYRSLTAVALAITGYPAVSGPAFFRLTGTAVASAASPKWKRPAKAVVAPKEEALDGAPAAETTTD
ncbi:MAG: DUF2924 domain-containing protein [Planctomycetes bacterium]|nr:DUF2924 domain-containing protein [Planctomycetota bacterium]